jgi:hypothetical protein
LRAVLAESLLSGFGGLHLPDGLHVFAAIGFFHQFIIEGVAGFGVFGGPDDGFGGVGELAAGEIVREVGLDPGDVVAELEAELLRGEADGMDDVGGAGNPAGAVGFQDALAGGGAFWFAPIAIGDGDHFAGVAGDAAIGEELGRVGEDEVDGGFGDGG